MYQNDVNVSGQAFWREMCQKLEQQKNDDKLGDMIIDFYCIKKLITKIKNFSLDEGIFFFQEITKLQISLHLQITILTDEIGSNGLNITTQTKPIEDSTFLLVSSFNTILLF